MTDYAKLISDECDALKAMLIAKNRAYGSSAFEPLRIFSRATSIEQILVRLDDKLSRLARGDAADEDVILDLLGYLILLRVARRREKGDLTSEVAIRVSAGEGFLRRAVDQAADRFTAAAERAIEQAVGPIAACGTEHVAGEGGRCQRPLGHDGAHDFGEPSSPARWPGRKVPRDVPSAPILTLGERP